MPGTPSVLAVVDAPYRGTVERGYADCFYLSFVLGAQLGGLTLLLRGEAVLLGHEPADGVEPLDLDGLRAAGVRVLVSRADRDALGLAADPLRPGVETVDDDGRLWAAHDAVWFV
ncbi:hypothetical protein [Cellulomonas shaoxiangyii]|uniref:Sulfur reduction protein DsrE n=1 Tax=Cellulomonas shaoxiangyii TaxID=2566013 RepID=A0A4P7SI26_9CELL|nr:hypothetical protein [Cellulomonas shaoxiangyii]QCB92294.1 hypothetical protein E5225_00700 [Cellulomonas shaoxiangyii]TGY85894.1 hypothetical protein E5226_04235 [Cellulomonas shaoxiangyii]